GEVASLDDADRPLAAFALLTAVAPYQVDTSIVESFRARRPTDAELVGAAGWAAFTAARRVGGWFAAPGGRGDSGAREAVNVVARQSRRALQSSGRRVVRPALFTKGEQNAY